MGGIGKGAGMCWEAVEIHVAKSQGLAGFSVGFAEIPEPTIEQSATNDQQVLRAFWGPEHA
jgi:hypothetical protein